MLPYDDVVKGLAKPALKRKNTELLTRIQDINQVVGGIAVFQQILPVPISMPRKTWRESAEIISPPYSRARATARRVLPEAVAPRIVNKLKGYELCVIGVFIA